jgi:hypothetical protein
MEGSVYYKAYANNSDSHVSNGTISRSQGKQIGEFSIVSEEGARYNY